ncbi:receptor homology region, transmembrane domain- and RING domain-containing protein 6-like [Durio zibethinus]|uniref:RING-type E3 ubiquitin transferase n=1 Tax=Durio zibethinus TaxID=66656 RepID=A0A6P5YMH3_DURZI|nr:receptor homology region, transmembrane domain- and RING domain-containing protein 6-like [Durio zibethinus]
MDIFNSLLNQMVLNKLVAFICNLIGVRVHARIKEAATAGYVAIKPDISKNVVKEGSASNFRTRLSPGEVSAEGEICCVCLSSMEEGDDMRVLPCLHRFHRVCVDRWLNACRKNCPVCRFSMGQEERFHRREAFTEEMLTWFSSFHVAGF